MKQRTYKSNYKKKMRNLINWQKILIRIISINVLDYKLYIINNNYREFIRKRSNKNLKYN